MKQISILQHTDSVMIMRSKAGPQPRTLRCYPDCFMVSPLSQCALAHFTPAPQDAAAYTAPNLT